jgi:hypothetical protein
VTEPLLSQQLESPSGTGRVEPRSQISLAAPAVNKRDTNNQLPHSHWQFSATHLLGDCQRSIDTPVPLDAAA